MEGAGLDGFRSHWRAEVLERAPMIAPARQYVWPVRVPGEEEAMARGAVQVMVRPDEGGAYLLTCALGFQSGHVPTGVWGCPNPEHVCVVAGGYPYLADVRAPERCTFLAMRPVVEVRAVVEAGLMLFVGFHGICAWGMDGLAWETGKLSWEGVRVTEVRGGEVRGFGWDMRTDKEVEFGVELRTGRWWGGAFGG